MRMRTTLTAMTIIVASALVGWLTAAGRFTALAQDKAVQPSAAADRSQLPLQLSPFERKIGKTYKESDPALRKPPTAAAVH